MTEENNISGISSEDLKPELKISQYEKSFLFDKSIAISVSNSENLNEFGLDEQHLNDISIELARYIITNDGTALYGGDLRENGFTKYFEELSSQYTRNDEDRLAFINYFAHPFLNKIDKKFEREFKSKRIGLEKISCPKNISFDYNIDYQPNKDVNDRYIYAECFRVLREKMTEDCNAKIIVGGKLSNYLGYIPGVLEEAIYQIESKKPLYIVGGFGGVANEISKLILGEKSSFLSNDFQYNSPFLEEFKDFVKDKYNYYDYEVINNLFVDFNLNTLSKNNFLTENENKRLFISKNIHEITYLIMKGMNKAFI